MEYWPLIVSVLLAVSEGLAQTPWVKSNSVLQLVVNVLKNLKPSK